MPDSKQYVLITGACKGIGRALADEFAQRKCKLLLISDDENGLQSAQSELSHRYNIECHYFTVDLLEKKSSRKLFDWVTENNYQLNTLVNNVGIGKGGFFSNMAFEDIWHMINLNCRVMTELSYLFLPMLKENGKAYILNMSSIESTLPLPYKAVYTGTKNYVYAFSLALRQELKKDSVGVTAVCPGPVLTNKEGLQRMNAHGKRARLLMLYPPVVARQSIHAMYAGKDVIVPGNFNKVIFRLGGMMPRRLKMRMLNRLFSVYKD